MNLGREWRRFAVGDLDDLLREPGVELDREDAVLDGLDGRFQRPRLRFERDESRLHPPRERGVLASDLLEELRQRLVLCFDEGRLVLIHRFVASHRERLRLRPGRQRWIDADAEACRHLSHLLHQLERPALVRLDVAADDGVGTRLERAPVEESVEVDAASPAHAFDANVVGPHVYNAAEPAWFVGLAVLDPVPASDLRLGRVLGRRHLLCADAVQWDVDDVVGHGWVRTILAYGRSAIHGSACASQ
jgi:hypothetical protein